MFVKRRMAAGESHAEIARRLGKSPTLITMISAMIDPPPWLLAAYRSGQCKGIAELYELGRLHERNPDRALGLVEQGAPITRTVLNASKEHRQAREPEHTSQTPVPLVAEPASISATTAEHPHGELLSQAFGHCSSLESIVERMRAREPDRLAALGERLASLCAGCLAR